MRPCADLHGNYCGFWCLYAHQESGSPLLKCGACNTCYGIFYSSESLADNPRNTSFSLVNYLINYRLQWGKPDTLSQLKSALDDASDTAVPSGDSSSANGDAHPSPTYFTADTPPELISIIMNDWPYSGTSIYPHCTNASSDIL